VPLDKLFQCFCSKEPKALGKKKSDVILKLALMPHSGMPKIKSIFELIALKFTRQRMTLKAGVSAEHAISNLLSLPNQKLFAAWRTPYLLGQLQRGTICQGGTEQKLNF
jgi:hypothetical protein